ncbi:hypothetical protein COB21_02400 [Candidatus Aerophobetes bacterium]|uniref:HAMP domain-containing protein n=1 Tax=Aerophobetes bacterium TaxID=2030807 RepID=A0A2A4X5P3_UNCAE|nr:MAG: hypothetical protein COB21_02400 [Candidatus Aerophobetes bacterium]
MKMEKSSYEKTSFALARRIVLLFFFLVFIPLAVLTGLLFREEYILKHNDKKILLTSMMEEHLSVSQEEIEKEQQFLKLLFFTETHFLESQNFLKRWASERKSVEIFHIRHAYAGSYLCDYSSLSYMVGKRRGYFQAKMEPGKSFAVVMSKDNKKITFLQRDQQGGIWAESYAFDSWSEFLAPHPQGLVQYKVFVTFDPTALEAQKKSKKQFTTIKHRDKKFDVSVQTFPLMPFEACYFLPKSFGISGIPEFYNKLSIIVVILFCVGLLITFFILPQFTKPFKQLFEIMQQAGRGNLKTRFEPKRFGFEVNEVGKSFNEMMDNLDYYIVSEREQRAVKEQLKKELELGRAVQKNMLGIPAENSFYQAAVFFRSAKEVGGDFFDFFPMDDAMHKVMFLVADTSGKGLDACLFSLSMRSILRAFSKNEISLATLAQRANDVYLRDSEKSQMFITAWIAIFDTQTKILEYCNLGHNPPLLAKKGKEIVLLNPTGIAFGVDAYSEVKTEKIQIQSGDKLLLYTDGISEAFNKKHEQFSFDRLEQIFTLKKELSPEKILKEITTELNRFCAKAPISDDQTLIVLEFN